MSRLVYVAGPYSSDPEAGVAAAIEAGNRLLDLGLYPVIPHMSHYLHQAKPRAYEVWMRMDFALLRRCDALLRLPGESSGADREVALARSLGLPVYACVEALAATFSAVGRNGDEVTVRTPTEAA